ncbi:MAG: hypothetical protein M3Q30_05385 [Actinomycetota bacterium]|nr:hypothetical protein [Actinomycetota bacterium]
MSHICVCLQRSKAKELLDSLEQLLRELDDSDWHAYVSSGDHQTQITVTWERPRRS